MNNKSWHSTSSENILKDINTSIEGLRTEDANERLISNGPNKFPKEKRDGLLKTFVSKFTNPLSYILIIAVILSFAINEVNDAIVIIAVIFMDACLGTFQEWKAGKAADSLQSLVRVRVKVLRDGQEKEVDSEQLVVGDIVIFTPGDKVSADIRLIETKNLTIDESVLTGESMATTKTSNNMNENVLIADRDNMAYAGTSVVTGRGMGVVVAIGMNTEIGQIADKVLCSSEAKTPIAVRMNKFSKQVGLYMAIIALIVTIILYFRGYILHEIVFSVIALSISAIPEGLSLALTLSLSVASNRMAKKNVIVKKLNAVESLGSCTVIASDKTGTLTSNQQTAKKIILPDGRGYTIDGVGYNDIGKVSSLDNNNDFTDITKLAKLGAINNEAKLINNNGVWDSHGDSIDIAFLSLAYKLDINKNSRQKVKIINSIPYESEKKYSAVFYEEEKTYSTIKGSVETVLSFCTKMMINGKIIKVDKDIINKQNDELSRNGYRVIAIAQSSAVIEHKSKYIDEDLNNLTFIGLVGFIDPVRVETIQAIEQCKHAGIKVVMITGDHPLTSFAIAKELKLVTSFNQVISGENLDSYQQAGEENFDRVVNEKLVFSRVTPLQKLAIVESFKRQGEFIAVTGDGVNDTPAMKAANIGVAMGSGVDVAKEIGDMVITDDNFMSIVLGIREGRNAYNNIRKVIYLLISTGFAEVLFFVLSIVLGYPMPLVAIQLLWLNLVTDGIQDAALSFEKSESDVMSKNPRKPGERIFNRLLCSETIISGITIGVTVFIFWIYLIDIKAIDISVARGYVLLLMVFIQNIHVFNCRSEHKSAFKIPFKNNRLIVWGILATLCLQLIITGNETLSNTLQTTAIPFNEIAIIFMIALPILFVMEIFKMVINKKVKQ